MTNKELKTGDIIPTPKGKKAGDIIEFIAKKDHIIVQNDFKLVIKKGESIKDLPTKYIETLKNEQVI